VISPLFPYKIKSLAAIQVLSGDSNVVTGPTGAELRFKLKKTQKLSTFRY
jgi:hypothetical protein